MPSLVFKGKKYKKINGHKCNGCYFGRITMSSFGGCAAPKDFPEAACTGTVVYKRVPRIVVENIKNLKQCNDEYLKKVKSEN